MVLLVDNFRFGHSEEVDADILMGHCALTTNYFCFSMVPAIEKSACNLADLELHLILNFIGHLAVCRKARLAITELIDNVRPADFSVKFESS